MSKPEVEHAPLSLPANPAHRKIQVLAAGRQQAAVRLRALLRIDAQEDVHVVAQHGFLQLKGLIGDLELLAPNAALIGLPASSTFIVIISPFHGWPPFSVAPIIRLNSGHWP